MTLHKAATRPAVRVALGAFALAGVTLVSGCTSSGSSSPSPTGSHAPTSSVPSSPTPVNSGTVKRPKHVAVYKRVTAKQAKKLEARVAKVHGVQSVGYVPTSKQLSVYFTPKATVKQRKTAKKLVHRALPH